uniref:Putative secreted protein n=1 Tax=Rhipicephalus microplus TaxID=6941 RepID=A0A6M2D8B0_RHIMP
MSPWKLVWCLFYLAVLTSLAELSCQAQNVDESVDAKISEFFRSGHTNNWAVLVCTSRFWFNYRHVANVLSIYRSVKRFGIPDSQIILMIADDMPCNLRNPKPATVFNNAHHHINVYGDNVEVDYRGYEHHGDPTIGVYVIDRYTYYALMFLEEVNTNNTKTMAQFLRVCPKSVCISTAVSRKDLFTRNLDQVPLTDFFGSVRNVELTQQKVSLKPLPPSNSFLYFGALMKAEFFNRMANLKFS